MSKSKNNIEDIYPLSSMQQGLLFHSVLAPESGVYVEQLSCTLYGTLNTSALKQAGQTVVNRHPVLRTAFIWKRRDEPVQVVYRNVSLPWEEYSWVGVSAAEQEERLDALLETYRASGLTHSKPPLMKLA